MSKKIQNPLDLLEKSDAENEFFKILDVLISSDSNLDLKTEIDKPFKFSALKCYSDFLKSNNMVESANVLEIFMSDSFRYLISKNRKSRDEIIKALQSYSSMMQIENSDEPVENGLKMR